jgi:hypothetical protein
MTPLTLLYTANLGGKLDLLPQLYTFIRQLRAQRIEEDEGEVMLCAVQPIPQRILLLDLGSSCAADVWHCTATGGRSTLMVLDAMGYHAVNVTGLLTGEARERLKANVLTTAMLDDDTTYAMDDLLLTTRKRDSSHHTLHVLASPGDKTHIDNNTLELVHVEASQVGMARVDMNGKPKLLAQGVFTMPSSTLPDPTIAATVDFVLDEARHFSKKLD